MASPHTTHFAIILQIIHYMKSSLYHTLEYILMSIGPMILVIVVLSLIFFIFLIDSPIYWRVTKLTLTAHSNTEYEYCALVDTTSNILLLTYCGFVRFFLILRHQYDHQQIYIVTIAMSFTLSTM